MVRKRQGFFNKPRPPIYLGEWLSVLGVRPVDVAKAVEVTESYLSELIAGTAKLNPSSALMFAISEFLGLSVNDLYRPPPPKSALQGSRALNPSQIAALGRLLDEMKPSGRK